MVDGFSTTSFNGSLALELRAGDDRVDCRATVLLHGAQVVSWTIDGREQLYVSPTADFRDGAAIRGGIPVCFPQFDRRGPLPQHGFARNLTWDVERPPSVEGPSDGGSARLVLGDSESTRQSWPHAFRASLSVHLGRDALDVELSVANIDSTALEFTGALHTYLRLYDQATARLDGLGGVDYRVNRTGDVGRDSAGSSLPVHTIGRIYPNRGHLLELSDGTRRVAIANRGLENVVVWNPGMEMTFPDLPVDGWRDFLCVEAAQVDRPVTLQAGERWSGGQHLEVRSLAQA